VAWQAWAVEPWVAYRVQLNWADNAEADLDHYDVFRAPDVGGAAGTYEQINASDVAVSQYEDAGLPRHEAYWYRVRAVDDAGQESGFSTAIRVVIRTESGYFVPPTDVVQRVLMRR
jgi:hypothetical protein